MRESRSRGSPPDTSAPVLKFANQIWNLGRSDVPVRPPAVNLAFDVVLACSLVGIAFIGRWLLGYIGPHVLIFAICYPAVLAATLIAGLRCGMISLVLSTLIFWWAFVPPAYTFTILSIVCCLSPGLTRSGL